MTHPADTIRYATERIADYQADSRYDYNSQLQAPKIDLMAMLRQWLMELLSPIFGSSHLETIVDWVLIALFVAIVVLVAWLIWKYRPDLFLRDKPQANIPYQVENENIYDIDFDHALKEAIDASDYREAIRLLYLQTLRFAADREWIDWQLHKTPTEYIYELKPTELRPTFRTFSNGFLQVRYGNYKADRTLFDTLTTLQQQLTKGGRPTDED